MATSILIMAGLQHFPAVAWSSNGICIRAGVLWEITLSENVEKSSPIYLEGNFFGVINFSAARPPKMKSKIITPKLKAHITMEYLSLL